MQYTILELTVLSVVCGAVISIVPEGGSKKICQVLSTAILIIVFVDFAGQFDLNEHYVQASGLEKIEIEFNENLEDRENVLNGLFVKKECMNFIFEKAAKNSVEISRIEICLSDSEENRFYPHSIEISGSWNEEQRNILAKSISTELGIPEERQNWLYEE